MVSKHAASVDAVLRDNMSYLRALATHHLLWHGTEDSLVPVTHGQWLAARIPGVVAHFEEGEGHFSIADKNMDRMLRELVSLS